MTGRSAQSLTAARRRDSTRRRQRVLSALDQLAADGQEISVSAVARAAGVDWSFLYRHHDLRAQIHARAIAAPGISPASTAVSRPPCSPTWPTSTSRTSGCAGRTSPSPPGYLTSSARKSSTPAASGTPTKPASYGPGSPSSNSSSSTCAKNSKSGPANSTRPVPPIAT